jgi:hypothetical protein
MPTKRNTAPSTYAQRELTTTDASTVIALLFVVAAILDLIWVGVMALILGDLPPWVPFAGTIGAFAVGIVTAFIASRRGGLYLDGEHVWWTTGINARHVIPRDEVSVGVRTRFGLDQATIGRGDGPKTVVPRVVVITQLNPVAELVARQWTEGAKKPTPWTRVQHQWKQLNPTQLEYLIRNDQELTELIADND